jgi:hypothetical protein
MPNNDDAAWQSRERGFIIQLLRFASDDDRLSSVEMLIKLELLGDLVFRGLDFRDRMKLLRGEFFWGLFLIYISAAGMMLTGSLVIRPSLFRFFSFVGDAFAQSRFDGGSITISTQVIALCLVFADWLVIFLVTGFALWGAFVRRPPIGSAREMLRMVLSFATGQMATALGVLGFVAASPR